ncbi:hypothetical protein LFW85_07295 [Acinetobacter baumannii]|uniref:NF045616 family extracytoplasmic (lipo)protein n=1 Tax=Acinetobacter baumannii TaxID=470 RepID=UPI0028E018A2|nr:NF045616 family extracytoplasmic (lipo)protein [Acinetobacter baumannii]MDT8696716.1 hypothetical protein [Acinetobacter baumannii]
MNKYIFLTLLIIPFSAFATSNPYRGGEVIIEVKNNTPCFYINDTEQRGDFSIVVLGLTHGSKEYWNYDSSFEKSYPVKNKCIVLNEKNFKNFKGLKENTPYSVTLGGVRTAYNKDFCVTKRSGTLTVQDFKGTQCVDVEASFWDKLKRLFN